MSQQFFSGLETGDASEWTTVTGTTAVVSSPVFSGSWAGKITSAGSSSRFQYNSLPANSAYYARLRVQYHVTTNPGSIQNFNSITFLNNASTAIGGFIRGTINTDGTISLRAFNSVGLVALGPGEVPISADTWYLVEFTTLVSATAGFMEWKLDGAVKSSDSNLNNGSTNITQFWPIISVGTGSSYLAFDDVVLVDVQPPTQKFTRPFPYKPGSARARHGGYL